MASKVKLLQETIERNKEKFQLMENTLNHVHNQNQFLAKEIDFGIFFVQSLMSNIVKLYDLLKEEEAISNTEYQRLIQDLKDYEQVCRNKYAAKALEASPPIGIATSEAPTLPATPSEISTTP